MTLQIRIVTTDGIEWEGEAPGIRVPALDGDMGIRSGHQPVLAVLHEGTVHIEGGSSGGTDIEVQDGFVSVDQDVVTVVVADAPMDEWLSTEAMGGVRSSASAPATREDR